MADYENKIHLLVDSHHGVYVPQVFVDRYRGEIWGLSPEDIEILKQGPEKPLYWDTWDRVLNNTKATNGDGTVWTLHQDGDLWAVRDDMTESDWEEWGV